MLSDVKIRGQKEDTIYRANGRMEKAIVTTFDVGNDGPFSVDSPIEGFDAATHQAKIEAKADLVRGVRAHPDLKR